MFTESRITILNKFSLPSKLKYFEKIKQLLSKLSVDELLLIHDVTTIHRINELFYGVESDDYEYNTKLNIEMYLENVLDLYAESVPVEINDKYYTIELCMTDGLIMAQCKDFLFNDNYLFVKELTKEDAVREIKKLIRNLSEETSVENSISFSK